MVCQDVYGEPRIFNYPGMTVRVYSPILADEERIRRMKAIEKTAADVLREAYTTERKRENEQRKKTTGKKSEEA